MVKCLDKPQVDEIIKMIDKMITEQRATEEVDSDAKELALWRVRQNILQMEVPKTSI